MVDVMETEIGVILRKTRLLSDTIAWYDSVDGNVRRQILNWIQIDQLFNRGIDSTGTTIGWYSQLTEILSGGEKKFNTHYTLKDTGQFYKQMFVVVLKDALVIDSDGAYKENGDNLFQKYGENIVGLTNENLGKLQNILRQKYIIWARKMLQIN